MVTGDNIVTARAIARDVENLKRLTMIALVMEGA